MPKKASPSDLPAPQPRREVPAGQYIAQSLEEFEDQCGGRQSLIAGLIFAPKSRDLEYLLGIIAQPANLREPLAVLCQGAGVRAGELLEAYRQGILAHAQTLSTIKIAEALPGVAADTMKLAAPWEGTCTNCQGLGTVVPDPTEDVPNPDPAPCPVCTGLGRLTFEGDLEHKKLALDLGRLLPKAGGISQSVQVGIGVQGGGLGGSLENLQTAVDAVLYGDSPSGADLSTVQVQEGEILPDPPPADPPLAP